MDVELSIINIHSFSSPPSLGCPKRAHLKRAFLEKRRKKTVEFEIIVKDKNKGGQIHASNNTHIKEYIEGTQPHE